MGVKITPRAVARWLAFIVISLTLLSGGEQIWRYTRDGGQVRWWIALFDLNREQNIPTYYQGASVLACTLILALISACKWRQRGRYRIQWIVLTCTFLLLSIDEMCSMHEQMQIAMEHDGIHLHGLLYEVWVVPALLFVFLYGLVYLRFVFHFPRPLCWWIMASGLIYVGGAVGMEMVGGVYHQYYGDDTLGYNMLATVEEFMEMAGIAIFMVSLLTYIAEYMPAVTISVVQESHEQQRSASVASPSPAALAPQPALASQAMEPQRAPQERQPVAV